MALGIHHHAHLALGLVVSFFGFQFVEFFLQFLNHLHGLIALVHEAMQAHLRSLYQRVLAASVQAQSVAVAATAAPSRKSPRAPRATRTSRGALPMRLSPSHSKERS